MKPVTRRWVVFFIVCLLAGLFAGVFFYLPTIALKEVNERLDQMPGYKGHVQSLVILPFRPSIILRGVSVAKREKTAPGVFIEADSVTVRTSWLNVVRKRWVADVIVHRPEVLMLFRQRRLGQKPRAGIWQPVLAKFPPTRINRLKLVDATFLIKNDDVIPPLDLRIEDLHATATNVANDARMLLPKPSRVETEAKLQGHAPTQVAMSIQPFRDHVTFDIAGKMEKLEMTMMNPSLRHYAGVEFERGTFDLAIDMKVHDGGYEGPVQSSIRDLTTRKNYKGVTKDLKASIMQFWVNLHQDLNTERMDKEFRFSGPLGLYDRDVVLAAIWVVKGAFVQSLKPKEKDPLRLPAPEVMIQNWAVYQAEQRKKAGRSD